MKTHFLSVYFLSILLSGCVPPQKKAEAKPIFPESLNVKHDTNECPELSGTYFREFDDNGSVVEENLELKLELKDSLLFFFNGKTEQIIDGQSHKGSLAGMEYQAGCDNGNLVFQTSVVSEPLGQIRYTIDNENLHITSKSLDETILKFGATESIWQRKF